MRRALTLALATAAVTAGLAASPASASHECYGVRAGDTNAGVCAGGHCTDLCFIVVDPYCYRETRSQADWCGIYDGIGIS